MLTALRNTIANFIGGVATLVALLVFNAFYFRLVSQEHFGVISLLLTATLLAPGFDLGTGRAGGRILARGIVLDRAAHGIRDGIATLQAANIAIGLILALGLALAAPWAAQNWLQPDKLSHDELTHALLLIAASVPLLLHRNYVNACMVGLKRQVEGNILQAVFTLLRGLAGLATLWNGNDGLTAFLWSQLIVQLADNIVSTFALLRMMPSAGRIARLDFGVIRETWRFAAADGGTALIGVSLAQADKILLSALLPLSSYGSYALISTIAAGIGRFTSPFSAAFLPHFTELMALERIDELRKDYLVATQLLSCVILPLAFALIAFSPEIVGAILGKSVELGQLPLVFAVLVAATILGNLMYLPHGVQIAGGDTLTAFRVTTLAALAYLILIVFSTSRFGIIAPAFVLLAIQSLAILFFTSVTHRMIELSGVEWLTHSLARPGFAAVVVIAVAWAVTPGGIGNIAGMFWLTLVVLLGATAALLVSPSARLLVTARLRKPSSSAT